jgi:hypothetical protein
MFGQFALLEPFGAVVDGVVLDGLVGVVVDGVVVVVAAVLEDDVPLDEEPVAAFAIATTLPAIAPVTSRLARVFRSLITSPPFLVV